MSRPGPKEAAIAQAKTAIVRFLEHNPKAKKGPVAFEAIAKVLCADTINPEDLGFSSGTDVSAQYHCQRTAIAHALQAIGQAETIKVTQTEGGFARYSLPSAKPDEPSLAEAGLKRRNPRGWLQQITNADETHPPPTAIMFYIQSQENHRVSRPMILAILSQPFTFGGMRYQGLSKGAIFSFLDHVSMVYAPLFEVDEGSGELIVSLSAAGRELVAGMEKIANATGRDLSIQTEKAPAQKPKPKPKPQQSEVFSDDEPAYHEMPRHLRIASAFDLPWCATLEEKSKRFREKTQSGEKTDERKR